MTQIHRTAIVSSKADIHETAVIGPYCIVGDNVTIDAGTKLLRHVVVTKNTRIGKNNEIFQFASIGEDCQDLKYAGEETWLEIGDNNSIREACSFHRGTVQDNSLTKIGSNNLFMVNTHIAHDCVLSVMVMCWPTTSELPVTCMLVIMLLLVVMLVHHFVR